MTARKYNQLGNVLYIIDRKGKLYIDKYGKVKRSTDDYHYELIVNTSGQWRSYSDKFITRKAAMDEVKRLANN